MEEKRKFYVYEWYRIDTGQIFYVGKGCGNRYKFKKRNSKFVEYINKYECSSRIYKYYDSEQDAFKAEYLRIKELWAIGQCSCNLQCGGTGGDCSWWTDQVREEYSKHNVMHRPEQRERMRQHNPMKNPQTSKIVAKKISKAVWIGNTKFDSLSDAAQKYNVTSTAILYWVKRGCSANGDLCYYDGTEPNYNAKVKGSYCKKSVIVDGVYYSTIEEAAKAIGGSPENLGIALRKHRKFKGHVCTYGNQHPSHENSDNKNFMEGSTTNQ